MGRGGTILTPNDLVLPFGDSYVCANFGENLSRNATVRVLTDGLTDANRFYNLSHAICYSYGTDNKNTLYETENNTSLIKHVLSRYLMYWSFSTIILQPGNKCICKLD